MEAEKEAVLLAIAASILEAQDARDKARAIVEASDAHKLYSRCCEAVGSGYATIMSVVGDDNSQEMRRIMGIAEAMRARKAQAHAEPQAGGSVGID